MKYHLYKFYIKSLGLYLQTKCDDFYTYITFYKIVNKNKVVVENSVFRENYNDFIDRVTKLTLYKI